jgi:hypothetical protein
MKDSALSVVVISGLVSVSQQKNAHWHRLTHGGEVYEESEVLEILWRGAADYRRHPVIGVLSNTQEKPRRAETWKENSGWAGSSTASSSGTNSRFHFVVVIKWTYCDLRSGKPRSRNGQIILFNPEIKKWCVTNVS